ncbi:kinase-like domain-containing protein, partial [Mycena maculata]
PLKSMRKVIIDDFEIICVLGKAGTEEVLLVRHKTTADLYALKAGNKRYLRTEQSVLKCMAIERTNPFVDNLWCSFHDKENLVLVMDFLPGGNLATQLAHWGLLSHHRARFYAAEIVEGVEGLHAAGVICRDLKPENILIGGDGHIVLTDFGLAKEFPRLTAAIVS